MYNGYWMGNYEWRPDCLVLWCVARRKKFPVDKLHIHDESKREYPDCLWWCDCIMDETQTSLPTVSLNGPLQFLTSLPVHLHPSFASFPNNFQPSWILSPLPPLSLPHSPSFLWSHFKLVLADFQFPCECTRTYHPNPGILQTFDYEVTSGLAKTIVADVASLVKVTNPPPLTTHTHTHTHIHTYTHPHT